MLKTFRVNWTRYYEAETWEEAKVLAEKDGHLVNSIGVQELIFVQSEQKDVLVWIQKYHRPGCIMY